MVANVFQLMIIAESRKIYVLVFRENNKGKYIFDHPDINYSTSEYDLFLFCGSIYLRFFKCHKF